jgi:hypothetical protein
MWPTDANPFAPDSRRPTAVWLLGVLLFAIMKLPLFLFLLSLGFIYTVLGSIFPVRALRRVIAHIYSRVIFQAVLFLTGLWSVHRQPTPLVDTYSDPQEIDDPGAGDVILSNCASYLNVFWLQCHYTPVFAVPVDADHVVVKSAFQLFFQIIAAADLRTGKPVPLAEVVAAARTRLKCPIALFPEAAVTNGRCLLNFQPFGGALDPAEVKFHIFGFVHGRATVSPNFVAGNGLWHLVTMVGRFFAAMRVKVALPQHIPRAAAGRIDAEFIQTARKVMATIMGARLVDMGPDDFLRFATTRQKRKRHAD